MSNNSIWTIDRTLSGAITPGQSGPGSNGSKEATHSTKLQRCSFIIRVLNVIYRTLVVGWVLTPLQICSRCILQTQLTGLICLCVFLLRLWNCPRYCFTSILFNTHTHAHTSPTHIPPPHTHIYIFIYIWAVWN